MFKEVVQKNIHHLLLIVKRWVAYFLLRFVLGWKVEKNYTSYEYLRKGRHVVTYTHTSEYEILLGLLFSIAYDIPFVAVAKREIRDIPIITSVLTSLTDIIFIDRKKNLNTTNIISDELNKRENFVFIISPEGTRARVSDLKSGFYFIALKSSAHIHHLMLDFQNHNISFVDVVNDAVVQTTVYQRIKPMLEEIMKTDKPYCPDKCHLTDPYVIGKTSLFDSKRSILMYLPPFIVLTIMYRVIF